MRIAKKILVIDDDEGILEGFEAMLTENGYAVTTSVHANDLFPLVRSTSPDLILLDVFLSGIDGIEICKKLKKNPSTKDIPIIMISAHRKIQKEIKHSQADDFLAKPFEMSDLLTLVKKYLKTRSK